MTNEDLYGSFPVSWSELNKVDEVYWSYRSELPWVPRMAAGAFNEFAGDLISIEEADHNWSFWVSPERAERAELVLGPHGRAIVHAYAYQRVEAKWYWRWLDRVVQVL